MMTKQDRKLSDVVMSLAAMTPKQLEATIHRLTESELDEPTVSAAILALNILKLKLQDAM